MTIDFNDLPAPVIIEEPSHAAILTRQNAIFREKWEAARAA